MKKIVPTVILVAIIVAGNSSGESTIKVKYKSEKEWKVCEQNIYNTFKAEHHDARTWKIQETCGAKPLTKGDCDILHSIVKDVCKERSDCSEGNLYDQVTSDTIGTMAIDLIKFDSVCMQVCRSKKVPDRKTFGNKLCKGK